MKKTMLWLMAIMLVLAFGCSKSRELAFDAQEPKQLVEKKGATLLERELKLDDILGDTKIDALKVADVDNASVTLCVWKNEEFRFVNYDYYSNAIQKESKLYGYDYFVDLHEIQGKSYAICADINDTGMKIKIVDIYAGAEVAQIDGYKLPYTALAGGKIYLCVAEKTENAWQDKIYSFDRTSMEFTGESYEYKILKGGKTRGKSITAMGAASNVLYRQITTTNNELWHEGTMEISATDFANNAETIIQGGSPLLFVSGDEEYLFGSVYNADISTKNNGFCYDTKNKAVYNFENVKRGGEILELAKLGQEYLVGYSGQILIVNPQDLSYEPLAKNGLGNFAASASGNKFAYVSSVQGKNAITISQRDAVSISAKIDKDVHPNLQHEMPLATIAPLHEAAQKLYYLETSTYGNEKHQLANAIVWQYDMQTKATQKLGKFQYIFMDFKGTKIEDGILKIPHDMDKMEEIKLVASQSK